MSHAQRFLHAEGGYHPITAPKMLPIRQTINSVRGLRAEPKAALVEVCELAENGKRKQCDATNSYLAERLGTTGKNVSRLISGLVAGGWLDIEVKPEQANRRVLVPTAKTRAHYQPEIGGGVSPLSAVSEDTHIGSEDTPEVGIPHPRSGDRVSPKVGVGSPQKWGDLSTTKNDHSTTKYDQELASARAELIAAQKKITELQAEVEKVTTQRNQLRAERLAQRSGSAHQGGAPADPVHFVGFAQSPYATPEGFATLAASLGYPKAFAPFYVAQIGQKAQQEDPRTLEGWQRYVKRWLFNDADKGRLQTTDPNETTSAHASHSNPSRRVSPTQQRHHVPSVTDYGTL